MIILGGISKVVLLAQILFPDSEGKCTPLTFFIVFLKYESLIVLMLWNFNGLVTSTSCEELTHWKTDAGRDWGQEEKGTTEDEMAGWHHRLDGREFEWTPGVGDGQGGLACCDSWGRKESDTTERLNWTVPWKKSYDQPRQHIKK